MIVVTGATGTIGSHLVALLAGRGEVVVAISRSAPTGREQRQVQWAQVDLENREAFRSACAGASAVFVCTSNDERMVRIQKNAIRAAHDAGVSRVVKLSALGASDHSKSIIGTWHYAVEHALLHAGGDWTVLRPHAFMQNLFDQRRAIRDDGVIRSAAGDGRIPFIDTRDIAEVAATVLTTSGHEGRTYTLTGGDAMSWDGVAATLTGVLAHPVRFERESLDEMWHRLRADGVPAWHAAAQLALAEYQRAGGPTAETTDTVRQITGRSPTKFETFVRDHREQFLHASLS